MTNSSNFALRFSRYFDNSNNEDDSLPNAAKIWIVRKFSDPGYTRKKKKIVKLSVHRLDATSYVPQETETFISDTVSSESDGSSESGDTATSFSVTSELQSLDISPLYSRTDVDPVATLVDDFANVQQKENQEPVIDPPTVDKLVTPSISLDAIKGEPRIIMSVIGEYNKLVHGYSKKNKAILVNSFKNISIRAGSMYLVNIYCI
ncbi:uncharacterized protein LOC127706582 [Mytilus californianus]|uniref:uncharacterized protein LOC127706582 n=1 Tax=Mytilus californianus TaxID=6549 RepID=UPI0022476227|nr:uncharacterized protein LOC127706582 [Mytilus californianus]